MNASQETMKLYNEMWNNVALKKKPVYSLRGCLESYNEKMLRNICTTIGVETSKTSESKEEVINRLVSAIQQDMKNQLSYLTRRQAYFLVDCTQKPYTNRISEAYGLDTIFPLVEVGWIYWFEVGEDNRFVLPEELKKIVKNTFFEGDFFFRQQSQYKLSEYIEAFVHLYGVFDIDHLLKVWNQHHLDASFSKKQVEEFVRRVNKRQTVFESDGSLIYSAREMNRDIADSMMQNLADIPYYIPRPEEIWPLAYKNPAQDSVQFQQLEKYVRRWIRWQPERVLDTALVFTRAGVPSETTVEELLMDGVLDPMNTVFINQFSFLYKKLLNASRTWLFRGHTSYEMVRIQELPRDVSLVEKVVRFPYYKE